MMESIKIVRDHNAWRRGGKFPVSSCEMLGRAIDDVSQAAARYEYIRTLNIANIGELWRRNLAGEGALDDLIDAKMKATKGRKCTGKFL